MSRVAKNPIKIPSSVNITFQGDEIQVKGSKGALKKRLSKDVTPKMDKETIYFEPNNEASRAIAGTTRALVNNMVIGVNSGFVKELQLVGVGYKAQAKPKELSLTLGHSHPINHKIPEGITIETPSPTEIIVKGIDKELVGQVCADIISYRKIEPYKGKGVRYKGQIVILKEAKKK